MPRADLARRRTKSDEGLVSVVIPTRDRSGLLGVTLTAVLAQEDVAIEVIVVDDGSIDETPAYLAEVAVRDPRVRTVRQDEGQGVSSARNLGVEHAHGEWVAFTDDDDVWAPTKLRRQLDGLARTPEAGWSCVGAMLVDADLRAIRAQLPWAEGDVADTYLAVNAMPGGGSGVVARTELVRRVGGFDCGLKILADWDLWVRLARESPLTTVADPLLAYRLHEGAMSWQLGQVRDELHRLEEKYASWRSASGLRLDRASFEMWLGDRAQRAGDRRVATSAYLRAAAVMGRPKAAVRLVESLLWPRAHILHDRYRRRLTSENHLTGVEAWLAPIRTVELAARVSERAAQAA